MPSSHELIARKYAADGEAFVRRYREISFAKHLSLMKSHMGLRPGMRVLDIGCGTGALLVELAAFGVEAVGIDTFEEGEDHIDRQIAEARAREAGVRIELTAGDATRMPYASGEFDIAVNLGMLEHIPPAVRPAMLSEMFRVVKPGGSLFLVAGPTWATPFDQHIPSVPGVNWLPHAWKVKVNGWTGRRQFLAVPWGISRRSLREALPASQARFTSLYGQFFSLPSGQPLGPFRPTPFWILAWAKRKLRLHRAFGAAAQLLYLAGQEHCHILAIRKVV
jgi:SAM-dependent methyltransferase